jgi:hypothetical protein
MKFSSSRDLAAVRGFQSAMSWRWLILSLLCVSVFCTGQPTVQFHLKKDRFAPGEPVILYSEITNPGPTAVNVSQSDPYGSCSGFDIGVSSDPKPSDTCEDKILAISCLSSDALLPVGKSRTDQLLLNFNHKVDVAGVYDVEVSRRIKYVDANLPYFQSDGRIVEAHGQLHFEIDESMEIDPKILTDLIVQLHSKDDLQRVEAARTLTAMAPRSQEGVLLSFKDDVWLKQFAPMAMYKLKTERSMAALAELLVHSEPGSYEASESLKYLKMSGDPKWLSIVKEAARQQSELCHGCRESQTRACNGNK